MSITREITRERERDEETDGGGARRRLIISAGRVRITLYIISHLVNAFTVNTIAQRRRSIVSI